MKPLEELKNQVGNTNLAQGSFIVLYGDGTYEVLNEPFENAVRHCKQDSRYKNYSHDGAVIIGYKKFYSIKDETKEEFFN